MRGTDNLTRRLSAGYTPLMTDPPAPERPNRFILEIPPQLRQRFRRLRQTTGRSEAELIRQAMEEFADRREGPAEHST
jgi:hypothetical protein